LPNSESEIKIPLYKFFIDSSESKVSVPFSLNLSGESSAYPGDWYHAANLFYINLPNAISLRNGDSGFGGIIPINMYISSTIQIGDFNIMVKRAETNNNIPYFLVEMLIVRDNITKYYIYAMAFLPILLSCVFAHSNFANQKNKEKLIRNIFLETSALMFSVLPLRSVLVPSHITGLVSVDLVLGLGIAIMVLIVLIIYALEVWIIR
jgi:hypothetical protein